MGLDSGTKMTELSVFGRERRGRDVRLCSGDTEKVCLMEESLSDRVTS